MPTLDPSLRDQLATVIGKENADGGARAVAKAGAWAAVSALAVHLAAPYAHLDATGKQLRNRLRARARQLGDTRHGDGRHGIDRLVEQTAYEHWHRMLFARFLAENDLLIHPEMKVAVTLDECAELAASEGAADGWELAGRYASRMLPQIFRLDDPLLALRFAIDDIKKLEELLDGLPAELFRASDSLGWCYQFWQARKKKEVNASEVKIGADELPAVTQLFTEPYMVQFLLHNTLGAWWAGKSVEAASVEAASSRLSLSMKAASSPFPPTTETEARHACALPGITWDYLRFLEPTPIGLYRRHDAADRTAANLPHWRQEGATYFVTFRTADSLPQGRLEQWRAEKDAWLAAHPEPRDEATMRAYVKLFPDRIENWLDAGYGACHLRHPEVRRVVEDALRHFDGTRYALDAFTVAGNHVHVIVTPMPGHELSEILHSWKSFTAKVINKAIGGTGAFWQKESFDHIVRSETRLLGLREYIWEHDGAKR